MFQVSSVLVGLGPVLVSAPVLDHLYPVPSGSGALESLADPSTWYQRSWCYHSNSHIALLWVILMTVVVILGILVGWT